MLWALHRKMCWTATLPHVHGDLSHLVLWVASECFTSLHPKDKSWVMKLKIHFTYVMDCFRMLFLKHNSWAMHLKLKLKIHLMLWIASECFIPSCLMCGTLATIFCIVHFWESFVLCWKYNLNVSIEMQIGSERN